MTTKTRFERRATLYRLLCRRAQGTKKIKKVREVAISHLPPPYTLNVARVNLDVRGRVRDVINHARLLHMFKVNGQRSR